MNEQFSSHRLGLLIRNDIVDSYRSVLFVSATILCIMVINALINGVSGSNGNAYAAWFPALLFGWGTIVASFAFAELHDKAKNHAYLLLPASALEKTLARLLYGLVGFVPYLLVLTTVASFVAEGASLAFFGRGNRVFDPFEPTVWLLIRNFVVVQSFFFLGAAWFRKAHYVKTVMSLAIIAVGLSCLFVLLARLVIGSGNFEGSTFPGGLPLPALEGVWVGIRIVYFVVLPILCWSVAWLRVKETQVSHGV